MMARIAVQISFCLHISIQAPPSFHCQIIEKVNKYTNVRTCMNINSHANKDVAHNYCITQSPSAGHQKRHKMIQVFNCHA